MLLVAIAVATIKMPMHNAPNAKAQVATTATTTAKPAPIAIKGKKPKHTANATAQVY